MRTIWDRGAWYGAVAGTLALSELLLETKLGLGALTLGPPLAYRQVLVEVPGALWFLLLMALETAAARTSETKRRGRFNALSFYWAILGQACVFWVANNAGGSAGVWQYWLAAASISAVFVSASMRQLATPWQVVRMLPGDMVAGLKDGRVLSIVAAALVLTAAAPSAADVPSRRPPVLRGAELLAWYDGQPRLPLPEALDGTNTLTVATFLDYQCAACRSALQDVTPVFAQLAAEYGGAVRFVSMDFPLDGECNPGIEQPKLHPLACESAAVVKLAGRKGIPAEAVVDWLWSNQGNITAPTLLSMARTSLADAHFALSGPAYELAMRDVGREAIAGQRIGVKGTPTYWINGVVTQRRSARDLDALIRHEMTRRANSHDGDVQPTKDGGM